MLMDRRIISIVSAFLLALFVSSSSGQEPNARDILQATIDQWRGSSSYSEMTMIIHRPDWERRMSVRAWTKGEDLSLVRVTAPARDAGSATLLNDNNMWTFAPNINRVIKVPSSMMAQSWMGSDFSNKEIARSDDILDDYDHSLLKTEQVESHLVYHIESIPHETAAVVWGREVLQIREDHVVLRHDYYDQDDRRVKTLLTTDIAAMGGRVVPRVQRMTKADAPEEWTEIQVNVIDFDVDLSDRLFTVSNLRNPRQ